MMTTRKRVGPLPTHRLAIRYLVDYSSSDHLSSDDSSRDSSSSSSSETSLDSSTDALSDSASSHLSFDHSLPTPSSGSLKACTWQQREKFQAKMASQAFTDSEGLEEFKQPEVNEYGPRLTLALLAPLKVEKDWKEKNFCINANQDAEDDVVPFPRLNKKTVILRLLR
ncbi:hypothetical protein Tco_0448539 [Tanacetum coccineum]